MTEAQPVDITDVRAVEFFCQCGGAAVMRNHEPGISCDINAPDVEIRARLTPIDPDQPVRWFFKPVELAEGD